MNLKGYKERMNRRQLITFTLIWILFCGVSAGLRAQNDSIPAFNYFTDSSYIIYKIDSSTYHAYQKPGAWQHFPNSIKDVKDYTKIT